MSDSEASTLNPSTFLQLQEEERQRLAQALMTGPGQILANALMEIEYTLPLMQQNPDAAFSGLNALRNELREGLAQLQRYVAELQPPLLDEMGLGPSIQQYVQKFGESTGIAAECHGCEKFSVRYPVTIEITLFRILQEALMNVQTHSKATRVHVELTRGSDYVEMAVKDNGRGFAPRTQALPNKRQLGLIAMRDRAELLGGQMQLFSENGRGVRVVVRIPYHGHPTELPNQGGKDQDERTHHSITRARGTNHHTGGKGQESKSGAKRRTKSSRR
ncbi:MAG TPA: sensor histidine kinase [Anaerolineae bacterium]|nr:sensor histidine kinase [Anaerolineae bacterium]